MTQELQTAIDAAGDKKAIDPVALEVKGICSFTDYFLIFSGSNPRQVQAISDEIELRLKRQGLAAHHIEGYSQAEWVLMDYIDFVVHIFSEKARLYYDLERLWRAARRLPVEGDRE
jgi:ribosome-associated protein